MDPLLIVVLFWAILTVAMTLFGIACIKYGVYTSGNNGKQATLEI
jgi:hypothetical protein